jgi:7,8-dihydroneopterin aldolase/epimerase/oxygenase
MVTVFIEGLEFFAYHGVSTEEKKVGHRYLVDLEYDLDAQAIYTDRVEDTVDYAVVALWIQSAATTNSFATVERLGQWILDDLFREFPSITGARLRLAKLLPPAPFIAESVGVELERHR